MTMLGMTAEEEARVLAEDAALRQREGEYAKRYLSYAVVRDSTRDPRVYYDRMVGLLEGRPASVPCPLAPGLGYRPGELTEYAGINGHGKSLLMGQIAQGLALTGEKCCIASPEMRPERTLMRMYRQALGRAPANTMEDRERMLAWLDWISGNVLIYSSEGGVSARSMLGAYLVNAECMGVKHFFIDNLMRVVKGEDTWNEQKDFVDALSRVAQDTGTHCHLVCHMKKGRSELDTVGKFDIRGSAAITDIADNVVVIQRNLAKEEQAWGNSSPIAVDDSDPDTVLNVVKQRNGDWDGKVPLWFERESACFCLSLERERPLLVPSGFRAAKAPAAGA